MTPSAPQPAIDPPRHAWFKAVLFALLAANCTIYVLSGTPAEVLDSIAWFALLTLYELETGFGMGAHGGWTGSVLRGIRLLAGVAVIAAATGYVREREWLDAVNTGLWIALVVMFEWQVRFPAVAARRWTTFTGAACLLYAGLGLLVIVWIWRGEWLDAYDALLWLAALVVIEMNILRRLGGMRVV